MDDKEFRRRLSEVADWIIPETTRETSLNAKKTRGKKSNEDIYCESREQMFLEEFGGVNPTYPPMLTKVKTAAVDCEDCGRHCANGRKKEAKIHESNNKIHWRTRCVTCNVTKNPYTGEFDLPPGQSSIIWNDFLRQTSSTYNTPRNRARAVASVKTKMKTSNTESVETFEDEHCVIRVYTDLDES